jgi:hypothetical protein
MESGMNHPEYAHLSPRDIEIAICAAALPVSPGEPSDENLVLYVLGALDPVAEAQILAAARQAQVRRRLTTVAKEVDNLLSLSLEELSSVGTAVADLLARHAAAALNIGVRLPSEEASWCGFHEDDASLSDSLALLAALVNVEKIETPYFEVASRSAQPVTWTDETYWDIGAHIDEIGSLVVNVSARGEAPADVKRLRLVLRHQGIRLPLGVADLVDGQAQLRAVGVARLLGMKKGAIDADAIMVLPCENQTTTRVLYVNEQDQEIPPFAIVTSEPVISKGLFEITLRPSDMTLGSVVEVAIPVSHRGCWQRVAVGKWSGAPEISLMSKLPWDHEEGVYSGVLRLRRLSG